MKALDVPLSPRLGAALLATVTCLSSISVAPVWRRPPMATRPRRRPRPRRPRRPPRPDDDGAADHGSTDDRLVAAPDDGNHIEHDRHDGQHGSRAAGMPTECVAADDGQPGRNGQHVAALCPVRHRR